MRHALAPFLLVGVVLAQAMEAPPSAPAAPLPGSRPGLERWIATFHERSFDLEEFRAAILEGQAPERIEAIVAGLEASAARDQAEFDRFLEGLGGRVTQRFWLINGCAFEIPASALGALRAHPRVAWLEPDREIVPLAPIKTATNNSNHCADAMQTLGFKGAGRAVAILDTGQDANMGGSGRPHVLYFVNGDVNNKTGAGIGGSRLLANVQVGLYTAEDFVGHGTMVAGIAAGESGWAGSYADRGHAPMAGIVGYGLVDTSSGSSSTATVATAWQRAAADKARYGIVAANCSMSGNPDPRGADQQALDAAALNADILPVVAAGNTVNTYTSQAAVNGLAVGAVAATTKAVASFSSRGPIYGDSGRFYPDIAACGVDTVMPVINKENAYTRGSGTSMASPMVAGAATLFRSIRTTATALETKAALLAATEDIAARNPGLDRNAYGLGFLRDDQVCAIARGTGTLLTSSVDASGPRRLQLTVRAGKEYRAVIAWNRNNTGSLNWSNLSLAIKEGSATLGSADSPRNLYEKVIFTPGRTGTVTVEVAASFLERNPLAFALAVFEGPQGYIPGGALAFGQGCPGTAPAYDVAAVIPTAYASTWGEGQDDYALGKGDHRVQQVFAARAVPGAFTASGLAFRHDEGTVRSAANYWAELEIEMGPTSKDPAALDYTFASNITDPLTLVLSKQRINLPYWSAPNASLSEWLVKIPFTTPFAWSAPSGRNLLVDFRKTDSSAGNAFTYYWLDAVVSPMAVPVASVLGLGKTPPSGYFFQGSGSVLGLLTPAASGAVPGIACHGEPRIGAAFNIALTEGRSGSGAALLFGLSDSSWAGVPLPLGLGLLGAGGCSLLVAPVSLLAAATDPSGAASFPVAVPADKNLIEGTLFFQALVVDPGANTAGLAFTRGLKAWIGGLP